MGEVQPLCGQRDLVRPIAIHHRFAELATTIDHRLLRVGHRPRSTPLVAERGRTLSRSSGQVRLYNRIGTK